MRSTALLFAALPVLFWSTPDPVSAQGMHEDVHVYSSEPGGGSLVASSGAFGVEWRVTESLCAGGFCLYTGVNPGFMTPDDPPEGLFPLDGGTEVSLEVVAIDTAMSVKRESRTVDAPGESLPLGSAPGMHTHPEFQVTVEEGVVGDFALRFRLTASGPVAYAASSEYELVFTNSSATPTPTPSPTATPGPVPTVPPIAQLGLDRPRGRGDQVVLYFDARDAFTSFLNIANEGAFDRDVQVLLYDSTLGSVLERIESIPARGTRTIDVGSLRASSLPASAGVAFATVLNESGVPVTSGDLAGSFTVANLATSSAWGGPGAARLARQRDGQAFVTPPPGTPIDGVGVLLEQLAPGALDLSVYYDPATLQPASEGGNQVIFASFADGAGLPLAAASQSSTWTLRATRNGGELVFAGEHATEGVEVSHLAALAGAGIDGSAGHLGFLVVAGAANRLIFFQESLGTFATGYLLPSVPGTSQAGAPAARSVAEPAARGDQLVFYYDAREGFTTFLNLANESASPLDVRLTLYDASLESALERAVVLPSEGTRTIDVGSLRGEGLAAGPGLALAVAVDAGGMPISSAALAGSFTVANLATASAWGAPAAARRALVESGEEDALAPAGMVIDGVSVALEQIQPDAVDLAVYYDPDTLEPPANGGNQLVFLAFEDSPGDPAAASAATQAWNVQATRSSGEALGGGLREAAGVRVSHLAEVIGANVGGSAGRAFFQAVEPHAANRMIFFVESLGTFATGYRLPALVAAEENG